LNRKLRTRAAVCVASCGLATALVAAGGGLSAPDEIEAKQEEAQAVLAEIRQIDSKLSRVVDEYNGATIRLGEIDEQIAVTDGRLDVAKDSHAVAQRRLADRLVALYQNGGGDSWVEILLGSGSLDEMIDRVDAADRVSDLDARILTDVRRARAAYRERIESLQTARAEQKRLVTAQAEHRAEIERQLAERQRLHDSISHEVERLQAEEAARQAELAAEAKRRLSEAASVTSPAVTAAAGPSAAAVPGSRFGGVVGIAMQFLGIPYQWGGASPDTGFDCSGFVMYVYAQVGVSLPHNAAAQYGSGVAVSREQLEPGDLVFFDGLGHNGIYIGGGQFIHSPHTGDVVKISSLYDSWYAATYVGGRRIL
jgi:cell wall-associated NlpC family hydrolase